MSCRAVQALLSRIIRVQHCALNNLLLYLLLDQRDGCAADEIVNKVRRSFWNYDFKAKALFFACSLAWMVVPTKSLSGFTANFCQSCGGKSALMMAAHTGSLGGVLFLLDHGADVCARDDLGRTVLDYALMNGFTIIHSILEDEMRKQKEKKEKT